MCDKKVKVNLFVKKIKLKVRLFEKDIETKNKMHYKKKKKMPLPKWTLEMREQWSIVLILSSRKSIVYKS